MANPVISGFRLGTNYYVPAPAVPASQPVVGGFHFVTNYYAPVPAVPAGSPEISGLNLEISLIGTNFFTCAFKSPTNIRG